MNNLLKGWRCRLREPPAAEAETDLVTLTVRLEAAPFQSKIKSGVFQQTVKAELRLR